MSFRSSFFGESAIKWGARHQVRTAIGSESLEDRRVLAAVPWAVPAAPAAQVVAAEAAPLRNVLSQFVSEQQKENLNKLKTDLKALKDASTVTQEMKDQVRLAVCNVLDGIRRPDPALLDQLISTVQTAREDGEISAKERGAITQAGKAVLASMNITPEEVAALKTSVQTLVKATNLDKQDLAVIRSDLRAIVTEFRANHPGRRG